MQNRIVAAGRPSKYKAGYAETARKACEQGARDVDVAELFGVSLRTVSAWKVAYPEFGAALRAGKSIADDAVERSLFQRATGFSQDAVKFHVIDGEVVESRYVVHHPPDTTACIFWLKNRRPAEWRDRHEIAAVETREPLDLGHLSQAERDQMRAMLTKGSKVASGVADA